MSIASTAASARRVSAEGSLGCVTLVEMSDGELERLRETALGFPGVIERLSHGAPCFFVGGKRPICYYHDEDFSDDGRSAIWCPAPPGVRDEVVDAEPDRFFRPQPSARGVFATWLGVYLHTTSRTAPRVWNEIDVIIEDAYRLVAPKALINELDQRRRSHDRTRPPP